jgi:class 3 adenylate cyclase
MSLINLKSIVGKKKESAVLLALLSGQAHAALWIEDAEGNILWGEPTADPLYIAPINANGEEIGFVKGDETVNIVSQMLTLLANKELERKRLGSEVLHLYQEINLIFNFSEKLAQTIEPSAISRLALDEAMHSIHSDGGVVVLWDEEKNKLMMPAASGENVFNEEELSSHAGLLLKVGLSGNSEIIANVTELAQTGIISDEVRSVMYAALKVKHRIMGAVILASKQVDTYAAGDLKLLVTLSLQASAAIESALQYEKNIREAREREETMRRIHEVTKKFVPFEFIQSLGRDVLMDLRLGDHVEKVVTVLFTDIRDYTTISEQMTPQENFAFVCLFNEQMGPIIRKHKGFINQYQGDSIMAIFPDSAAEALSAAAEMQSAVQLLNKERKEKGMPVIKMGIGMHTGPLIMGITGDKERMDATTIADTVNTASRLESLTKYYKSSIIFSDATLQQISNPDRFFIRSLGFVQLKGKKAALHIHECFNGNLPEEVSSKLHTLEYFREGLDLYLQKSFEESISLFGKIIATDPKDQTAKIFLANAVRYMNNGVPENWTGVEEMVSK